jgi:hypothetical protein
LLHTGACVTGLLFTQEAKQASFVDLARTLYPREHSTGWISWLRSAAAQLMFESNTRVPPYEAEAPFEENLPALEWMERILVTHPALPKIPVTVPYHIDPIVTRKKDVADEFGWARAVLGESDQLSYTELFQRSPRYSLPKLPSLVNLSEVQTLALVDKFGGAAGLLIATIEHYQDGSDFPLEVNMIKVREGDKESLLHYPTTEELDECEEDPTLRWWRERP